MTVEILALIVVLLFFIIDIGVISFWWTERAIWAKERHDLLNRLMVKDWPSYIALQSAEVPHEPMSPEDAPVLTTNYDKAWAG